MPDTCPLCQGSGKLPSMLSTALMEHQPRAVKDLYMRLRLSGMPPTRAVARIALAVGLTDGRIWQILRMPE